MPERTPVLVIPASLDHEIPFASAFGTWSERAVAGLGGQLGPLSSGAREALTRALLVEMSGVGDRALMAAFRSERTAGGPASDREYRRFVTAISRPSALGRRFPVLERLLDLVVEQWVSALGEVLDRYRQDRSRLRSVIGVDPGSIIGIAPGLGDRHHGGRTVVGLRPEHGPRLAYKPRSVAGEASVSEMLPTCPAWNPLRPAPWVIDCDGYGWMEWVEREPISDGRRYWSNAGVMAAVLHLAGAHDLHGDNLVIAGDAPFAIDLECWNMPGYSEEHPGDRYALDSVMQTGLFPNWFQQDGRFAVENAGLFPDRPRIDGRFVDEFTDVGTDEMDTIRVAARSGPPSALPRRTDGTMVPVDLDALLSGFESASLTLAGGADSTDHPDAGRRLLRSTLVYGEIIASALAPDALADERTHRSRLGTLPVLSESLVDRLGGHHDEVIAGEVAAMAELDVPSHWFDGVDLVTDRGPRIRGFADLPGSLHRRERRERWDTDAGRRVDRESIRLAVEHTGRATVPPHASPSPCPGPAGGRVPGDHDGLKSALAALAERLWQRRLPTEAGPTWLEIDGPSTDLRLVSHATDLYSGTDGIACALAAIAAVLDDHDLADHAREALWSPRPQPDAPGFDTTAPDGLAGWIYARLVVGRLLDDSHVLDAGVEAVPDLVSTDPGDHRRLDRFGGLAGTLDVAITAASVQPTARTHHVVGELADQLYTALEALEPGTIEHRRAHLLGTAHGSVGVSAALLRAARMLRIERYLRVAGERLDLEEARVGDRAGIGAKFEGSGAARRPRADWCWGSAGYVITRTAAEFDDTTWRDDTHLRSSTSTTVTLDGPDRHHLCCGLAGRLIAATSAIGHVPTPGLEAGTSALLGRLTQVAAGDRPARALVNTSVETDGLFGGLAGVGYALAHHLAPEIVPNVLRLS